MVSELRKEEDDKIKLQESANDQLAQLTACDKDYEDTLQLLVRLNLMF